MTKAKKTILGVFSHPDDESMGPGGTLAKYAAAGHRVVFITATDGGAGRLYEERPDDNTELRRWRRHETQDAADSLGVEFGGFLGWEDGTLDNVNILDIEVAIAKAIRRERPDVLMTFHGSGISYHPDHRVMSLALNGAFFGAGREGYYMDDELNELLPHQAAKLYQYTALSAWVEAEKWPRVIYASPDHEVSTLIDTADFAERRWQAIEAHATQANGPPFKLLYDAGVFAREGFVRIFPYWAAGDAVESDLLANL